MVPQPPTEQLESSDTSFFGHPRGLSTLFLTELWERFSYYGMRALLILYMTAKSSQGGLGFDVAKAAAIYGLYTAAVYLTALPGGWLADHLFGLRRAVLNGGILIALGHYSLALGTLPFFYAGLILIVLGTGLLKPNVSALVGQLYMPKDIRRDAGFSIFYMGINLGAFISPLACGYLGQRVGWHLGFGLAAAGMTVGLVQFLIGTKHMRSGAAGPEASKKREAQRQLLRGGGWCSAVLLGLMYLAHSGVIAITAERLSTLMGVILSGLSAGIFIWLLTIAPWSPAERRRLIVILVLFVASAIFWSVFEQAGSTLNLFAERNTSDEVLGYSFPASWLQSLEPLFIILLAPVFAWIWLRPGTRNLSSAGKFVGGLVFASLGYAVLVVPALRSVQGVLASPLWLTLTYLLHTIGELCVSPVGLSAMTQLAPRRAVGMMMGVWFLSTSVGNYLGGRFASLYESLPLPSLFAYVALMALVAAITLAILAGPIKRLMVASEQAPC